MVSAFKAVLYAQFHMQGVCRMQVGQVSPVLGQSEQLDRGGQDFFELGALVSFFLARKLLLRLHLTVITTDASM